jgi:hypothetical protein
MAWEYFTGVKQSVAALLAIFMVNMSTDHAACGSLTSRF